MNSKSAFRPVVPREPDSTKEVVGRLIDQAGGTKQVAFKLGLAGPTSVQAYSDPAMKTQMTFDQVRRLTCEAVTAGAEDLAARAGGVFVPGEGATEAFDQLVAKSAMEQGEFIAAVLAGRCDAACRKELDDVIRVLVACRQQLIARKGE